MSPTYDQSVINPTTPKPNRIPTKHLKSQWNKITEKDPSINKRFQRKI